MSHLLFSLHSVNLYALALSKSGVSRKENIKEVKAIPYVSLGLIMDIVIIKPKLRIGEKVLKCVELFASVIMEENAIHCSRRI